MLMRITMVGCAFNFLQRSGIFYLVREKKFAVKSYMEEAAVKNEQHENYNFYSVIILGEKSSDKI